MSPPVSRTDAEVIADSATRPEVFAVIFDRHAAHLQRYLARRVDRQAADDLLAELFLIAFDRRGGYDPTRAEARPWLYGIAANLLASHYRSEARRARLRWPVTVDREVEPHADRVADQVSAEAARGPLNEAIAALAPGDREVLLLIAWEELSYAEVAEALDIPIGTVRSRLHRVRTTLRRALGGVDPSGYSDEDFEVLRHG